MDLKKQTIINSIGNTVYLFGLWFLTVITTHKLGYEETGTLTLAMSIGNVIATIQVFGARGYQSSDILYKYSSKTYLIFRCITIFGSCLIELLIGIILGYSFSVQIAIMLFVFVKASESFSDVLFGNDQRKGHLEYAGFSMAIRGFIIIILFGLSVKFFDDLNLALLIVVIGVFLLSLFVDLPLHNRIVEKNSRVLISDIKGLFQECFPLLITLVIPSVVTAFPRVLLERYYGDTILGYYGNISTPGLLLISVAPTILLALLPSYGRYISDHNFKCVRNMWLKTILAVVIFIIFVFIGILFFGKIILSFVYTPEIVPYIHYIYFIFVAVMFYIFTMCNNTVLVALRRSWGLTLSTAVSLIVCIIVSVLVVRPFGIMGAILSMGIPYAASAIIQIVWIINICKNEIKK